MKYNIWNAIAYEVTVMLINFDARWMNNKIVNMIRAHSFVDWCEWKTQQTMEDVDAQIEALHMLWDREDDDWRDVIIEEDEETGQSSATPTKSNQILIKLRMTKLNYVG